MFCKMFKESLKYIFRNIDQLILILFLTYKISVKQAALKTMVLQIVISEQYLLLEL